MIAPALRATVRKQPNTRAVWAEVHDFDLDAKLVWPSSPTARGGHPVRPPGVRESRLKYCHVAQPIAFAYYQLSWLLEVVRPKCSYEEERHE